MADLLIIEDEPGVQITLEDRLTAEGYSVSIRGDGVSGENAAAEHNYDLILLDIMLPGRDGFTVCHNLRKAGIFTPILMLTARDTNIDTVIGLRVGADDYLAKPFDMTVLLARIEALLRRASVRTSDLSGRQESDGKRIAFGDFVIDTGKGSLEKDGTAIDLNAQEYRLLEYLALHGGRIISRNVILDDVWGYESEVTTRTVDVISPSCGSGWENPIFRVI